MRRSRWPSKLGPARPAAVVRVLGRLAFARIRHSGSHAVSPHPDRRWTTVPVHSSEVAKGTLRRILKGVGIAVDEFEVTRRG
ncbi:MAG: type II toxin-antitoxin system HicA family toxin [Firmicutes bacterium]|nr:type II toxin-antitoxin system HicA family toxin [Bacillota bacterium]